MQEYADERHRPVRPEDYEIMSRKRGDAEPQPDTRPARGWEELCLPNDPAARTHFYNEEIRQQPLQ